MSTRYLYTANAWGYYHAQNAGDVYAIMARLAKSGCQGFDLLVGQDAYPHMGLDDLQAQIDNMRTAPLPLASLFLVSFGLQDVGTCIADLLQAVELAGRLAVPHIHLLPRKIGISRQAAFENLNVVWRETRRQVLASGVAVAAENHIWHDDPDADLFLLRTAADQQTWLDSTQAEIGLKFDPAWLLKAGEEPIAALQRFLPYVEVLDVKDYRDGQFVTPGTGQVDFTALSAIADSSARIRNICVECEAHHHLQPPLIDAEAIDALQQVDFAFYKELFR